MTFNASHSRHAADEATVQSNTPAVNLVRCGIKRQNNIVAILPYKYNGERNFTPSIIILCRRNLISWRIPAYRQPPHFVTSGLLRFLSNNVRGINQGWNYFQNSFFIYTNQHLWSFPSFCRYSLLQRAFSCQESPKNGLEYRLAVGLQRWTIYHGQHNTIHRAIAANCRNDDSAIGLIGQLWRT